MALRASGRSSHTVATSPFILKGEHGRGERFGVGHARTLPAPPPPPPPPPPPGKKPWQGPVECIGCTGI